jgi:hypothetical protein
MASRVAGAVLALFAAALLVVSVVAAPWWNGHPKFNGAEIKAKEIGVGPLGATGCNTGGDGACMSVPVDPTFETVGFALAGVTGLLAITALALGVFTAREKARRKTFAIFVIVGSMIAALLAVLLVVVGPKIRTEAPLPFSTGLFVFFGGITAALGASIFAMRNPPIAASRASRPSQQPMQHPVPLSPHGGLDVHALLADDAALRPSSAGPFGRTSPPGVHSPGGALAGPSGPLGAPGPQQPLFTGAPQLRPLYEANPSQGGTGGYVPQPHQNFPMRPPTPVPLDRISAMAGIPTPASIEAQRSVTMASPGAPPAPPPLDVTDRDLLGAAGMRPPRPKTLPPPARSKTSSMPPALPLVQARPLPTLANVAVPPPPNMTLAQIHTPDPDEPFDSMQTYQRDDMPSPRSAPELPPIAHAVIVPASPPAPRPAPRKSAQQKAASIAARVAAMGPPRPASPTGARLVVPMPARLTPRPAAKPPEEVSVDTDVSMQAISEDAQPGTETFETSTSESTGFSRKPDADDDAMTVGREKISRTDVELPIVRQPSIDRPPTETSQTLAPPDDDVPDTASMATRGDDEERATERAAPPPPPAPPLKKPAESAALDKPKLPISTAPDTLPPPTEKQTAASGPSPACPQCEAPMAWVEAHLRFYCKSCKMYF